MNFQRLATLFHPAKTHDLFTRRRQFRVQGHWRRHHRGELQCKETNQDMYIYIYIHADMYIYIYHLESRWLATPKYCFIMVPYYSPPFGSCAIYFHYGVYIYIWYNYIIYTLPETKIAPEKTVVGRQASPFGALPIFRMLHVLFQYSGVSILCLASLPSIITAKN